LREGWEAYAKLGWEPSSAEERIWDLSNAVSPLDGALRRHGCGGAS